MATGDEKIETPAGDIDGANEYFTTSLPYVSGTLKVWRDGVLVRRYDDDGWAELSPSLGTFRIREVPRLGDTLSVRYIEA
jgi:hypothetical protein